MDKPTFIVGVGASAGGLSALEQFFDNMPPDSGMAFIVIQHLSPDFKSLMDDLLSRHTRMAIYKVTSGITIEPDSIYLIPPKTQMTIKGGKLYLTDKDPSNHLELPIDVFLYSLAGEAREHAVAVILSGTGTDGSRGIIPIHKNGGLVLVQSLDSAQFDGMPRSAIDTGICDFEMAPEEMASLLMEYQKNPDYVRSNHYKRQIDESFDSEYGPIFSLLRERFNLDFSRYKDTTVGRRIQRRMEFQQIFRVEEYIELLSRQTDELDALYKDLLIGVTEFFRDLPAFLFLEEAIIPEILRHHAPDEEIRIWSAGCATGEEAYSIAILFYEQAQKTGFKGKITVFASDVHRTSLEFASAGLYERERLKNVSPDRLETFFRPDQSGGFKINETIRKMVVFAVHNLINDPPFTRIDLICCRNLLIYFQPDIQEKILSLFHFALRVGGILFLGGSEGLGKLSVEFEIIHGPSKLFRKIRDLKLFIDLNGKDTRARFTASNLLPDRKRANVSIDRQLLQDYDHLLRRFMPPGILVSEQQQILHFFGDLSLFIQSPEGRFENDVLKLIREDLRIPVNTTLHRAIKTRSSIVTSHVHIRDEEEEIMLNLHVEPVPDPKTQIYHYLIYFEDLQKIPVPQHIPALIGHAGEDGSTLAYLQQRITDLELELQTTKENLQTTVEELQTSNEELQATNEELLASNEELQSTNEELHSVNEELYTVNSEFEVKNKELQQLNQDHDNLLASTEVGTIFLDQKLSIRKYNPAVVQFFKLMPQDIGRPIDNIAYHLANQEQMMTDLRSVLTTGRLIEKEIQTREGSWLLKRILPFRTEMGEIAGVVLTFTDTTRIKAAEIQISRMNADLERKVQERTQELMGVNRHLHEEIEIRKKAQDALDTAREQLDLALSAGNIAWWIWDVSTGFVSFSKEKAEMLGYRVEEFPTYVYDICSLVHPEDYDSTMQVMRDHLEGRTPLYEVEYRIRKKNTEYLWFYDKGKVVSRDDSGKPLIVVGVVINIDARKKIERSLLQVNRKLQLLSTITRHDVLNNVMVIGGRVELLNGTISDPKALSSLQDINAANDIIRNLIEFTRSYESLGTEQPRWILIGPLLSSPGVQALMKGVTVQEEITNLEILADPMIERVFYNLVDNSVRHGGHVTGIRWSIQEMNSGLLLIYQDNGKGIPSDQKDVIFEKGYGQNNGFGLFLAREVLQITGMTLEEKGREGAGARFEIYIPKGIYRFESEK